MITFTTGNILESDAQCLVNTVNCEGYMGKGIAYQFKKAYPLNNDDYVYACKTGALTVGKIHSFKEKDRIIINFPTKDKWREKSKIEYITDGMDALVEYIENNHIESVAIPPLGCGNGGLKWNIVHDIIVQKVENIENCNVILFTPSLNVSNTSIAKAPKLNLSHLILMKYKLALKKFGKIRLQKTAYFMNLFMKKEYFYFKPHTYGPYAHSIEILSKEIAEFQEYYKKDTQSSLNHATSILISNKTKNELNGLDKTINKAVELVNSYSNTKDLELAATICFIISKNSISNDDEIVGFVQTWSNRKKSIYDASSIIECLGQLKKKGLVNKDLLKYSLSF